MDARLIKKYRPFPPLAFPERQWPNRQILKAPTWCSVDLRDGNQALVQPMNLAEKLQLYELLVKIGFKEIEIGFPSAAKVEFDFLRQLVRDHRIPDDVSVQALTQAREHLIAKTFESLKGVKRAILHLYNSTSRSQRDIVFRMTKDEVKNLALRGVEQVIAHAKASKAEIVFEYSPESFTGTEIEFALEVCEAVVKKWRTYSASKVILNLPATVELCTPNVYADMIEWFIIHMKQSDHAIISVHTHNDRGTGVAATELGLMAGATRVEGTLFGNGERTGNLDIVTTALNLYSQGIDPKLDLHAMDSIVETYEQCTKMTVPPRHPYAGSLVYTAFSGSHQDAIKKGLDLRRETHNTVWDVPYLTIDPSDLGRTYEAVIRINSQSGKGGVAYIMENEFGCVLPKAMHPEFGAAVQQLTDRTGKELKPKEIWSLFKSTYLDVKIPYQFVSFEAFPSGKKGNVTCILVVKENSRKKTLTGEGNGPIDACKAALLALVPAFKIVSYQEHSLSQGSDSLAISYIQIEMPDGKLLFGAGIDPNIDTASVRALISALNRLSTTTP